jgi:hypothetical protein
MRAVEIVAALFLFAGDNNISNHSIAADTEHALGINTKDAIPGFFSSGAECAAHCADSVLAKSFRENLPIGLFSEVAVGAFVAALGFPTTGIILAPAVSVLVAGTVHLSSDSEIETDKCVYECHRRHPVKGPEPRR